MAQDNSGQPAKQKVFHQTRVRDKQAKLGFSQLKGVQKKLLEEEQGPSGHFLQNQKASKRPALVYQETTEGPIGVKEKSYQNYPRAVQAGGQQKRRAKAEEKNRVSHLIVGNLR